VVLEGTGPQREIFLDVFGTELHTVAFEV